MGSVVSRTKIASQAELPRRITRTKHGKMPGQIEELASETPTGKHREW
jgi:hypothetical protein